MQYDDSITDEERAHLNTFGSGISAACGTDELVWTSERDAKDRRLIVLRSASDSNAVFAKLTGDEAVTTSLQNITRQIFQ